MSDRAFYVISFGAICLMLGLVLGAPVASAGARIGAVAVLALAAFLNARKAIIALVALAVLGASPADAAVWRKQSSTGRPVQWLMVSSTDHLTAATGLTVTATCSKDGGAFGACSGAVSEVGNGIYSLAGNATDRATLGTLVIRATATGADTAYTSVEVVLVDPFDGDFGLADLDAAISSRLAPTTFGRTLDVTATGGAGIDWSNVESPTTTLNLSGTTVSAVSGAVGSVTGDVGGNVSGSVASVSGNVGGNVTGSVGSVAAGGISASSIATDAVDADALATDAANEIRTGLSTHSAADVWAAGTRTLTSFGTLAADVWSNGTRTLTSFGSLATDATAIKGVTDKLDTALELDGLVYRYTTNALEQAPTGGAAPSAATIADALLDELLAGHTTSGSAGEALGRLDGIQAKTDLIVAGEVTVASPYNPVSGKLTLTRGDDYAGGDLPAFTSEDWPDLTDATVRMTVRARNQNTGVGGAVVLTLTDTAAERVAGAGEQSVLFEPLSAPGDPVVNNQVGGTLGLTPGANAARWDIEATLADGTVRTLATGLMDVIEDQTRP